MKPSSMTEVSSQESVSDDVKTCSTSSLDVLSHPESEPRTALQHSAAASKYLHQEDYDGAMRSYRQALHLYEQEDSTVGQCNAAATLHNMALLHKRCQRYTMAVRCFQEAENIYRSVYSQTVPREGGEEEGVCLEYLLIETLHNRAFLHSKYQDDVLRAIQCHEQAVETLLKEDDEELSSLQPIPNKEEDVVFIKLNNAQRVKLLVESLKNLGVFYSQRGEVEGALGAFEEALEFCRSKQVSDEEISESMATVYIHLASVYFEQEDFAEALDNLQQAMNVWIQRKEHPSHPEVLATINNMGLAHERMGNLDKALECYEDLLHVRSQFFGQDHVEVADSLSIVAKVLERQGNTEGALDLYQEAVRIYKQASIDQDASFHANAVELTCRIASLLLEDGQVEESIDKYQEALRMETSCETADDTATIYHGLGRAYMAKHEFLEAKTCLLKAARLLAAVSADEVQVQSLMESSEMLKQALQNESYLSSDGTWVNSEICIAKTPERLAVASIGTSPIGESSLSNEDMSRDESQHLSSQSSQLHLPLTSSPSLGLHLSTLPSTSLSESEESALSPSPLPRNNASLTTSDISLGLDVSGCGSFPKSPPSSPRNDAELEESALSPSPLPRNNASLTTDDISLGLDVSGCGSIPKSPPLSPRKDAESEKSALSPSSLPRNNASLTTSDISLGLDESGTGSFRKRSPSSPRNDAPLPLTTSGSIFALGESGRGACRESPPSSPPSRNDAPLPLTTRGNISDLDESVRGCLSKSPPQRSDAPLALATSGSIFGLDEPGRGSFRENLPSSSPRDKAPLPLTTPDSSFGVDNFGRGTISQSPPTSPVPHFVEEEFDPYSSPVSPESYSQSRTRNPGKVAVESRQASVISMADIGSPLRSPSDESDYESDRGEVEVTLEDFPFGALIDEPRDDGGAFQYHDCNDFPIGESAPCSLKPSWNSPAVKCEPKTGPEMSPGQHVLTSSSRNVLLEFFWKSAAVIAARDPSVDRVAIATPTTSRWPGRNEIQIYRSLPADVSGANVSTTAEANTQWDSLAKDESFGPTDFEQLSRSNSDGKECLQTLVMEFSMDDENLSEPHVVRTNSTNETLTLTASEQSGRGRSGSFTSDGLRHGKSGSFTSSAHSDSDSDSGQRSVSYDESDCTSSHRRGTKHERRRSPSDDESDYTASDQDTSEYERRRSHTFDESEYTASDQGLSGDENNDKNDANNLSTVVDNSASGDSSSYLSTNDTTDDYGDARLHSSSLNETASSESRRRPPAYDELGYTASDQATLEHETDGESDVHYLPTVVERTSSENACFYMSSHDTKDDDANTGLHSLSLNDTDYTESDRVSSGHETDAENNVHQISIVVDDTVSADLTSYLPNNDVIDEDIYSDHTDNEVSINAGTSGGDPENRDASPRRKSPPESALDASDQSRRMGIETHNLWWPTPPTEEGELDMSDDGTSEPLLSNSTSPRKKPSSPRKAGVISPPTSRGTSPRERFAKAFGGTFRRTRRGSRLDSMPEDEEHNGSPLAMDEQSNIALQIDQTTVSTFDSTPGKPISVVALQSSFADDNVSQITFLGDEADPARRESRGSWWWGATPEGLEGWFPVVVGAAEEFLSAQSIFDQVKSRKAERSSSDSSDDESRESDVFENLSADETEESEDTDSEEEESKRGTDETQTPQYSIEKTTSAESRGIRSPVMEVEEGLDNTIEPDVDDVARPSPPATKNLKGFAAGPPLAIQKRGCSPRIRPKAHKLELTLHEQIARLGGNHPDVASTLTELALLLSQAGERDTPVKLLREALTIWKSIGDQAAVARTLHKLGDVSSQQNQFNTALTYHREALKYERSVYGTCHLEIASTLNTIGTVHASLGEFDFAMTNHQDALHILKDCVGEDLSHPLVAQTLICIGAVYYKERNSLATIRANTDDYNTFIEAGMLDVIARAHEERGSYRMAIAFFEEKLQLLRNVEKGGMDQHEVVEALTRLGTLSRKAGVFLEALDYYEEAASIQSVLGRDQVEVAKHLLLTGTVHYHLGHFRQSLKLLTESLSILQATVGNDQQVLVAETFQRMGMVQVELCEFDSAMKAFGEALRIQSIALGLDHPATLQTRLSIAIVLMNQGELDSSIEQFTAILGTQSRVHGPKHPNLARSMYYIARAYEWKGDIETATKFYEESFFMAEDFLGHDHPIQAATLHGIADLQRQKRRYKKSLQILGSVLDIRKETLGERHIDVAMTLCSVASCQAAMGRFEDSTIFFDDALLIAKEVVGSTHLLVAQVYVAKGALFLRKCQFQEARDLIKKGLDIYIRSNVVEGHPRRVEAERMLERVERDELLCV